MNDELLDGSVSPNDVDTGEIYVDDSFLDSSGNDIDDSDIRTTSDIEVFDYSEVLETISYQAAKISNGINCLICLIILIFLYRASKCIVARFNFHGRSI